MSKIFIKKVSLLLIFCLIIQACVFAGGVGELISGLCLFVGTGLGYYMIYDTLRKIFTNTNNETDTDKDDPDKNPVVDPKNIEIEINLDGTSTKNTKIYEIRLRDSESGQYVSSLIDYGVWVSHTSSSVDMVIGKAASSSLTAQDTGDNFIQASSVPAVTANGIPNIIEYQLKEKVRCVKMDILDSEGKVVYSLTESAPNPQKPIPFVWKAKDLKGNNVPNGTYSIKLEALKEDGSKENAPLEILTIAKPLAVEEEEKVNFDEGKAYVTFFNISSGTATDIIYVKFKDPKGNVIKEARKTVEFEEGGGKPSVGVNPLNFSTTYVGKVEDVEVKVEVFGTKASSPGLKVTLDEGVPNKEIKYEYSPSDGKIKMSGSFGEKTYTTSNPEVYYAVLKMMQRMAFNVFESAGLKFDTTTNILTFDKSKFLQKSKIDPGYDIKVDNSGQTVTLTVSKSENKLVAIYDLGTDNISYPSDIKMADDYEWDIVNGGIEEIGKPVAAAGIQAEDIGENIKQTGAKTIAGVFNFIYYTKTVANALVDTVSTKHPMERPQEPDITDITWVDKTNGIVEIKGTASYSNPPVIYINNQKISDALLWMGSNWSVKNYSKKLKIGENKINAVVEKNGIALVESGDATVYKGWTGEPDLILVSPRDRQVFETNEFGKEKKILMKGITNPNTNILVNNDSFTSDSIGKFSFEFKIDQFHESENSVQINVGNKNFIIKSSGAYKFTNHPKSNGYVLRRGDFLFSNKRQYSGNIGQIKFTLPFEALPSDPDHVGVYVGDKKVIDAIEPKLEIRELESTDPNKNFYYKDFLAATQIPQLANESTRILVASRAAAQKGLDYDSPFRNPGSTLGHYNGSDNGFYCSELAYWIWYEELKGNFKISLAEIMYPLRNTENKTTNSVLPAYLCEKTMKIKEVAK